MPPKTGARSNTRQIIHYWEGRFMIVSVRTDLGTLACAAPNESADEPYLWTFFLKLDGDTVRQVGTGFVGSVQVHTAGGSHGNLSATGVKANRRITIPNAVGDHTTTLRPIEVTIPGEDLLRIPGQYVIVTVLLEEDNSDDDGIENGHQAVRELIELEANDFINGLDGLEVRTAALSRQADLGGALLVHAQAIVIERFDALAGTIRGKAKSAVTLEILAEHTPGFFWELIDADDMIDARTLRFDEKDLLNSPLGSARPVAEELAERDDDNGSIKSLYVLVGTVSSSFKAVPGDLSQIGSQISSVVGATGEHVFAADRLCVQADQRATWTRHDQVEEHVFLFRYPFLPPIWSVEGKDLLGSVGEIRLQKSCYFPYFHPDGRERPAQREEQREVIISFTKFRENGLDGVRLRNRPEDGTYYSKLSLDVTANGANRVHLLSADFAFDGPSITSPFYAEFEACTEKFRSVGEEYAKSKRIGPRELWGPSARQRWFEAQVQRGQQLVGAGLLSSARFEAIQRVARNRLRLR
jgi:hypothetical protein